MKLTNGHNQMIMMYKASGIKGFKCKGANACLYLYIYDGGYSVNLSPFFFFEGDGGCKPVQKCCSFLHCMWQITVNKNKNIEFVTPISLRKANIVHNFGLSECNRVNV